MSENITDQAWWKDIDVGRTVENLMLGIILFFGRYVKTVYLYIFKPKGLIERAVFDESIKLAGQQNDTRPLTYLVVSGFFFLAVVPDSFLGIETFQDALKPITEDINVKSDGITFALMAKYMLPFVLFVSIYSYSTSVVFKRFKFKHNYKVLLNIHCYCVGTIALLTTLTFLLSYFAWEVIVIDTLSEPLKFIPLFTVYLIGFANVVVSMWRYFQQLALYTEKSKLAMLLHSFFIFIIFWLFAAPTVWVIEWLVKST